MIAIDVPPQIILPEHYKLNSPAIIRPGYDISSYFPVEIDSKTRQFIKNELYIKGEIDSKAAAIKSIEAAIPFGMFKGGAVTRESLARVQNTGTGTSYTFNSYNFGTVAADRRVVIGIVSNGNGTVISLNTVTIGGVSATLIANNFAGTGTNNGMSCLAIATVPTGTTGSIVVTYSGTSARCGIGGWSLYGLKSNVPVASQAATDDPSLFSIATSSGGVALGIGYERVTSSAVWTGLTEEWDMVWSTNRTYTGASINTTGATISGNVNWSTASRASVSVASWR